MNRKDHVPNPVVRLRVSEWQHIHRRHLCGSNIEARLKDVENRVESLTTGVYPVWLTDTTRLCEVADELRAKAGAVNWMFRVAQRFSGPKREAILSAVEESLDVLENAIESGMHSCSIPSYADELTRTHPHIMHSLRGKRVAV